MTQWPKRPKIPVDPQWRWASSLIHGPKRFATWATMVKPAPLDAAFPALAQTVERLEALQRRAATSGENDPRSLPVAHLKQLVENARTLEAKIPNPSSVPMAVASSLRKRLVEFEDFAPRDLPQQNTLELLARWRNEVSCQEALNKDESAAVLGRWCLLTFANIWYTAHSKKALRSPRYCNLIANARMLCLSRIGFYESFQDSSTFNMQKAARILEQIDSRDPIFIEFGKDWLIIAIWSGCFSLKQVRSCVVSVPLPSFNGRRRRARVAGRPCLRTEAVGWKATRGFEKLRKLFKHFKTIYKKWPWLTCFFLQICQSTHEPLHISSCFFILGK